MRDHPVATAIARSAGARPWATGALVAAVATLASSQAEACRCRQPRPTVALKEAQGAIFGRVLATTPRPNGAIDFTIAVDRAWKRDYGGEVAVSGNPACSFEPTVGAAYLVFLRANREGQPETDSCMGNAAEPKAATAIEAIDRR